MKSLHEFHHFGYATKDIDKSEKLLLRVGFKENSNLIHDENLGVKVKFYTFDSSQKTIELVSPIDANNNPIASILLRGIGIYHLAFFSEKFSHTAKELELKAISECQPAKAFNGAHIKFYVAKDSSIIELISLSTLCKDCDNVN
jgi:methylmalonyl-CoA/ethylmalonyl-CoA epimerase